MTYTQHAYAPVRSEVRHGMLIDWDVPIEMDDGVVLRADVFRPNRAGAYPVIMSLGPYAKLLHFEDGYKTAWDQLTQKNPSVSESTSNSFQSWEVVDPERWVPDGYICVRVDSRGAGRSPGLLDCYSRREILDYAACVEWAADQEWSSGKVGLNGISYYGANQWQVASLQPRGLAAICVWEGFADFYRDFVRHGGIYCTFGQTWYDMQVKSVQHGLGTRGRVSRLNGDLVTGPETLNDEELRENRKDLYEELIGQGIGDAYFRDRETDFSKIEVPLLSAANWGGQGLHLRGNIEGFLNAGSRHKWLELHGREHWTEFYTAYGLDLQKRFFARFLKDEPEGWPDEPRIRMQVRHPGERFVERAESTWPLERTEWTRHHLLADGGLAVKGQGAEGVLAFEALGDGLTFLSDPLAEDVEITGPIAMRLNISSTTDDADIFAVVRVFSPEMKELTFNGALDPRTPIGQGWLRASHRKLDRERSLPYRPYHTHDEEQMLVPGEVYSLDVEILPTCVAIPKGWRIGVSIRGKDYENPGGNIGGKLSNMKQAFLGCGPFTHDDIRDRPPTRFGGVTRLHFGAGRENWVTLPVIPARR
jgi:uncharacterized protein